MKQYWVESKKFLSYLKKNRADAYAAQIAFFTLMSIIPMCILFISFTQYIPTIKTAYRGILNDYIPESFMPLVNEVITDAARSASAAIPISLVFTAWTAGKSIMAMTNGLNAVYDQPGRGSWFLLRGKAALHTILYILLIIVMLFAVMSGNKVQAFIFSYIPAAQKYIDGIIDRRFWIGVLFIFVSCMSFYKFLPDHKVRLNSQLPGALLASLSTIVLSYGLGVYVDRFNGFSMYGSITSLILLMCWLYFVMYIILVCGAFNHYFEERIESRRKEKSDEESDRHRRRSGRHDGSIYGRCKRMQRHAAGEK